MKKIKIYSLLFFSTILGLSTSLSHAKLSPLNGIWYNSYCSRVDLNVNKNGNIKGQYTSHTGSVGTSNVNGFVALDHQFKSNEDFKGTPFSLGINWRLINVNISDVDGSWNWTSSFSGQHHKAQEIHGKGQDPYLIPETLELNNLLIATSTSPYNDTAPVTWAQTLTFKREIPVYCKPVTPGEPLPYTAEAQDNVSGNWKYYGNGNLFELKLLADLETGKVKGDAISIEDGVRTTYIVSGLFDTIGKSHSFDKFKVTHQSLSLSLRSNNGSAPLVTLAGGVDLRKGEQMFIWQTKNISTTYINRFTQQEIEEKYFKKD